MFDISWGEMLVIGVVALVVIGPKELPGVIRAVGRSLSKLRTMAGEFRGQFDEAMREAELHEVKKTFDDVKDVATGAVQPLEEQFKDSLSTIKGEVAEASGVKAASETLQSIEADARALEAEVKLAEVAPASEVPLAVEAAPVEASAPPIEAPKPKRRKTKSEDVANADPAGDAA